MLRVLCHVSDPGGRGGRWYRSGPATPGVGTRVHHYKQKQCWPGITTGRLIAPFSVCFLSGGPRRRRGTTRPPPSPHPLPAPPCDHRRPPTHRPGAVRPNHRHRHPSAARPPDRVDVDDVKNELVISPIGVAATGAQSRGEIRVDRGGSNNK